MSVKIVTAVQTGMVHNYGKDSSRHGRWVFARDIPLQFFPESMRDRHPHSVPGLAWDIDLKSWRNMKNASVHNKTVQEVEIF